MNANHRITKLYAAAFTFLVPALGLAEGGGGHGGGHHEPHVTNWVSLGEVNKHAPALAWLSLTFVIFVGILLYFVKRPLGNYLEHRHVSIKNAIEEARIAKEEAERKKREYEQRLQQLDDEVVKMRAEFEARGRSEMERLEAAGKAAAERILKDAESTIAADFARAQDALKAEASRLALQLAEQRISAALTEADEAQLRTSFISEIAG